MRGSCEVGNYCVEGDVSVRRDCCVEGRVSRIVCRGSCISGCDIDGYNEGRAYVTNVMDVVCR